MKHLPNLNQPRPCASNMYSPNGAINPNYHFNNPDQSYQSNNYIQSNHYNQSPGYIYYNKNPIPSYTMNSNSYDHSFRYNNSLVQDSTHLRHPVNSNCNHVVNSYSNSYSYNGQSPSPVNHCKQLQFLQSQKPKPIQYINSINEDFYLQDLKLKDLSTSVNDPRARSDLLIKCDECEKVFCSMVYLNLHKINKHSNLNNPNLKNMEKVALKYGCSESETQQLSASISFTKTLKEIKSEHQRAESIQSKEKFCEQCNKSFCNKYFLAKHKQAVHGTQGKETDSSIWEDNSEIDPASYMKMSFHLKKGINKNWKCADCKNIYYSLKYLENHVKRKHCDETRAKLLINQTKVADDVAHKKRDVKLSQIFRLKAKLLENIIKYFDKKHSTTLRLALDGQNSTFYGLLKILDRLRLITKKRVYHFKKGFLPKIKSLSRLRSKNMLELFLKKNYGGFGKNLGDFFQKFFIEIDSSSVESIRGNIKTPCCITLPVRSKIESSFYVRFKLKPVEDTLEDKLDMFEVLDKKNNLVLKQEESYVFKEEVFVNDDDNTNNTGLLSKLHEYLTEQSMS